MNIYKTLILAGSFQQPDGYCVVNSNLVNEVAKLWAKQERGIDATIYRLVDSDELDDIPMIEDLSE